MLLYAKHDPEIQAPATRVGVGLRHDAAGVHIVVSGRTVGSEFAVVDEKLSGVGVGTGVGTMLIFCSKCIVQINREMNKRYQADMSFAGVCTNRWPQVGVHGYLTTVEMVQ